MIGELHAPAAFPFEKIPGTAYLKNLVGVKSDVEKTKFCLCKEWNTGRPARCYTDWAIATYLKSFVKIGKSVLKLKEIMHGHTDRRTQKMSLSLPCFFSINKDRKGKFYNDRPNSPLPVAWLLSHPSAEVLNIRHLHDTRPNLFDKFFNFHHFIEGRYFRWGGGRKLSQRRVPQQLA